MSVGDSVLFSPDLGPHGRDGAVDLVVVGRKLLHVNAQQIFVAERRPLPGGHWLYLPCAEGFEPLTSYDPAVSVVGVVVEIRRTMG